MSEEPVKNGVAAGDAIDGNTSVGSSGSAGGKKNKKGKNKNKSAGETGAVAGAGANLSADQQEKLKKAMEILNMQSQGGGCGELSSVPASTVCIQVQQRMRRRRPPSPTSSGPPSRCPPLTRS